MTGFDALDLLNIGFIVTSPAGRVLLANATAEKILEAQDGLRLTGEGLLSTSPGCNSPSIESILRKSLGVKQAVIALPRPSGKRPLTLLVRSAEAMVASDHAEPATILVFLLDPESPAAREPEMRQLYGLTSAETRLANLLMEGKTLDECCELLGIRRSTAKMHLRNVFTKTGVQRQGELVALLFNSTGSVRAGKGNQRFGWRHLPFGETPDGEGSR
jgi:DNA-binding CsgD family transcriptional regulator